MSWLTERGILLIGEKLGAFKVVQVASVMRRQKVTEPDGEIVDIIDYYPPWNKHRTYGIEKVCHEYLDHKWQIDRFKKWSGKEPSDIPLYESDTALRRSPDRDHQKNIEIRPFKLIIIPQPAKDGSQIAGKNLIDSFIVDNVAVKSWNERKSNGAVPQQPPVQTAVPQPPSPPKQPSEPQAPSQTVDSSPAPPKDAQASDLDGADHWQKQALTATTTGDVYGFDYALAKMLKSEEHIICNMREQLFGKEYEQLLNAAYVDGLSVYLTLRRSKRVAHPQAKEKALAAFEKIGRGES